MQSRTDSDSAANRGEQLAPLENAFATATAVSHTTAADRTSASLRGRWPAATPLLRARQRWRPGCPCTG